MISSGLNNKYKYFKVSAKKKVSIRLSFGGGTVVTSFKAAYPPSCNFVYFSNDSNIFHPHSLVKHISFLLPFLLKNKYINITGIVLLLSYGTIKINFPMFQVVINCVHLGIESPYQDH